MTRQDYRHAARRMTTAERRAWGDGLIEVVDRDGNWVLTGDGERALGTVAGALFIAWLVLLAVVL